jgi:hypothetical protein
MTKGLVARVGPFGLLGLGLVVRWLGVPNARFTGDEALFYRVTQEIVTLGKWPVFGPPVSGTEARHPGAAFYYLMSIPAAVSKSPLLPGFFVSALSLLAMSLMVRMARETRGQAAGWLAAGAFATSPWLALYADRIWNSNVAPWLAAVVFYGLWRMQVVPRSRWVGAVVAGLLVLFQFHLSAPIVWAVAAVQLARTRPAVHWRAAAVGFGVAVALFLPCTIAELSSNFANSRAILSHGTGGAEASPIAPALTYVGLFSTGEIGYHANTGYWKPYDPLSIFSADGARSALEFYGPWLLATVMASAALSLLGWLVWGSRFATRAGLASALRGVDPFWSTLWVGAAAGVGLLLLGKKPVYPHYMNLLLPVALVPLIDGATWIWAHCRAPLARGAAVVVFLAIGLGLCATTLRYYDRVDSKVGVTTSLALAETIVEDRGAEPFSLRFRTFSNGYALRTLARSTLGAPWNEKRGAAARYEVLPKSTPPPSKLGPRDALWDLGAVWLVRRQAR